MVLPRASSLKTGFKLSGFPTAAARPRPQGWRRWGRRAYASDHAPKKAGSDLPWMIGAVVFTVPAAGWLWQQGPSPSDHGHGNGHGGHEEHHESKESEEEPKEEAEEEPKEETKEKKGGAKPEEDDAKDESKDDSGSEGEDEKDTPPTSDDEEAETPSKKSK